MPAGLLQGPDVNSHGEVGRTPLFWGCSNSSPRSARILVAAEAHVNGIGRDGQTVLMSCFDNESIKLLIDSSADFTIRGEEPRQEGGGGRQR